MKKACSAGAMKIVKAAVTPRWPALHALKVMLRLRLHCGEKLTRVVRLRPTLQVGQTFCDIKVKSQRH